MRVQGPEKHVRVPRVLTRLLFNAVTLLLLLAVTGAIAFAAGAIAHRRGQTALIREVVGRSYRIPVNWARSWTVTPPKLRLHIDHVELQRLAWNRKIAMTRGRLLDDFRDEVPARIQTDGREVNVSVRLKGDLPDHWRHDYKWSLRVEVRGEGDVYGMRRFSIQHPATRSYLNGWFFHRLLRDLGLTAIRYFFVEVSVNGRNQGVYAVEEHRQREMLENTGRLEGPLFRAETQVYWNGSTGLVDSLFGSLLDAYHSRRISMDPALQRQYETARSLFEAFRDREIPARKVFDVERLATLIAVLDLTGHRHAAHMDNIVFYFNPTTALIEPIAGDNNRIIPAVGIEGVPRAFYEPTPEDIHTAALFNTWLMEDDHFFRRYVRALERISDPRLLNDFFREHGQEYEEQLAILNREFPWYEFDTTRRVLQENQRVISRFLHPSSGLHAYLVDESPQEGWIRVEAALIHGLPRAIHGLVLPGGELIPPPSKAVLRPDSPLRPLRYQLLRFRLPTGTVWSDELRSGLRLRYQIPGASYVQEDAIRPEPRTTPGLLEADFMRQPDNLEEHAFLELDEADGVIRILPGSWQLDRSLRIPPGHRVVSEGGVELTLSGDASIVSRSPWEIQARPESPFVLRSDGVGGQGLAVIGAEGTSILEFVRFEGLGAPDQPGWSVPGAITFYESPVEMRGVEVLLDRAEHAVHLVRSPFRIAESRFLVSRSQALRADFAEGEIVGSEFRECGADCISISGSRLALHRVDVESARGRGVSLEAGSLLNASELEVRGADVALAVRDGSRANLQVAEVNGGRVGLLAYQERSAFGPASIDAQDLQFHDTEQEFLLAPGSSILFGEALIEPDAGKLAEFLPGRTGGDGSS